MSETNQNLERSYGADRSPARTQNVEVQRRASREGSFKPGTQRDMHIDSPTKYDIDFYQRKVNRLENDLTALQDQLSLAVFRLHKAEQFEHKYEILFRQNQNVSTNLDHLSLDYANRKRENEELRNKLAEAEMKIKNKQNQIAAEKQQVEDLRKKKDEVRNKVSNEGAQEKASVEQAYLRQIEQLKNEAKDKEEQHRKVLAAAKAELQSKEGAEASLNHRLTKVKADKNEEIRRLKQAIQALRQELTSSRKNQDQRIDQQRELLINETEIRIEHVRSLTATIEQALMNEIRNLNEAIRSKDDEISFLIQADRKFMTQNEETQLGLKEHVKRLQDKIFIAQRQNEIELFRTIDRLKTQYDSNINALNDGADRVRDTHIDKVKTLEEEIANLKKENELLSRENRNVEEEHKKLANEKEVAVSMMSQRIIGLQSQKDLDLKNYTVSMREIEEDAKVKVQDLHAAMAVKNEEAEILNAQLALKNQELIHLIAEVSSLRDKNRQKLRKLQTTNSMEQGSLNQMLSSYKREILELKRHIHDLENELTDSQAQSSLQQQLVREELVLEKEANEKLKGRNQFLVEWCKQLENALQKERIANVDVLHDQSVSRRQTVQTREKVRVEVEAIKDKQVEQIRNVYRLEKSRLQADLASKEHELRDKKAQLNRLLIEYKALEQKVGRTSKREKGSEQNAKCQATLDAEILLTQNIYNAINRP